MGSIKKYQFITGIIRNGHPFGFLMFTSVMGKEPSYFCLKACGLNFSESFSLNNGPLLATFNNQKVEDFSLIVDPFLHEKYSA